MSVRGRVESSDYMHWAKTRSQARFNLATSGVPNFPLAKLDVSLADIELSGPSLYGYEPLQRAIAAKCDVAPECVVAAAGTSMANHLAMALMLRPGDEVLIEWPTYELLISTAQLLGATVRRFARGLAQGFRVEPDEVARHITSRTRLIVLTNLHNPSSTSVDEQTLRALGETAARVGARVLVDEVYLDALFERAPPTALHLGSQFVVTNSLTKVYGLSGLRCGWILAEPSLAARLWRLNDLFGVIASHPAERLACVALVQLAQIAAHARALLDKNRDTFNSFLAARADLDCPPHEHGTVAFPRWRGGDVDDLCKLLRVRYETTVVPGRFFDAPEHFRVSLCCDPTTLAVGLERLGAALDESAR